MDKEVQEKIQQVVEDPKLKEGINVNEILNMEFAGLKVGNIILAIIVLIICLIIKAVIDVAINKIIEKTGVKEGAGKVVKKVIDTIIIVFTVLITASTLGINTATLLVLIATFFVVVLMAMNAIIANMAGGVEIAFANIFHIGDVIQVGNFTGKVSEMTITHTVIKTGDDQQIIIPNKDIASSKIINNSALPNTKVKIRIGVVYGSPIDIVKKALVEAALADERVLKEPEPRANLEELKDSWMEFSLSYWGTNADARKIKPAINENIIGKFEEYGIEIAYNRLNVQVTE